MKAFIKLIRLPNLLIMALTMYAMRFGLIKPMLVWMNVALHTNFPGLVQPDIIHLQLNELHFFLLVLSTVMIAAAGYIINDYFDVKMDKINKPEKVVIDKGIKRRVAMGAHIVITTLAVAIAVGVSYVTKIWKPSLIFILAPLVLWLYSTTFKKQLLTGNIIIALLSAFVPLIVAFYELPLIEEKYKFLTSPEFSDYISYRTGLKGSFAISFSHIHNYIYGFAFFAFITTIIREIIKDIEDYDGDIEYGCKTMPIVYGINNAKYTAISLSVLSMILIGLYQFTQLKSMDKLSFFYLLTTIQIPFGILIFKLFKAKKPQGFSSSSALTKIIMIFGILFSFVILYTYSNY